MSKESTPIPIESGKYYWVRHISPFDRWRPCYIAEDADESLWLIILGSTPMDIREMDLNSFKFIELLPPPPE